MSDKSSVALIGAGSMGGSLLRGWVDADCIDRPRSAIFDPTPSQSILALCKASAIEVNPQGPSSFDVVVLAVKPQIAPKVLPSYAAATSNAIVASVIAGLSLETIEGMIDPSAKLARAMPNLPAAVGKGVTGIYARDCVTKDDRAVLDRLLVAVGATVWVKRESDIDLVTAISGSGPAYFFLLAEALEEAGLAMGLTADQSSMLARATLAGAGTLIDQETRSVAEMRKAVTSPGGTTEAALNVFDGDEKILRTLVKQATRAAADRAKALNS